MRYKEIVKEFEATRTDQSFDEYYVMIVIRMFDQPPEALGFDLIGPLPKAELDKVTLFCANSIDRIAPRAEYSIHDLHGRPTDDLTISPTPELWLKSATQRVFLR